MKLLNKIKSWWTKRLAEQDTKLSVHIKLPSGRTFDIEGTIDKPKK